MNLTAIEKEKLELLEKASFSKESDFLLEVGIFDFLFKIHLKGITKEEYHFLLDYYKHFTKPSQVQVSLNIYYQVFQDDRRSLNHSWYCSKWPARHFLPLESGYHILERDYAAFFEQKKSQVFAFGPSPAQGNPDSLDNLLTTLFASLNQDHHSLILHSAAVIKDQKAYVFFGESGAGKSTLAFHCYQNFHQKIISSDQTYLSWDGKKVWAQSTPITIPEIKRDSPMREWRPIEVAGFIHLTQKAKLGLHPLKAIDFLKKFVTQSELYLTPLSHQQKYLDKVQTLLSHTPLLGELTYRKDEDFWSYF